MRFKCIIALHILLLPWRLANAAAEAPSLQSPNHSPSLELAEQNEAYATMKREISRTPGLSSIAFDGILEESLKASISQWKIDKDPAISELEKRRNSLYLSSKLFFYDAFRKKGLSIPSFENSVDPAVKILESSLNQHWPELDKESRDEFIADISQKCDLLRRDPLAPSGKLKIDPKGLLEFKERTDSKIIAMLERNSKNKNSSQEDLWRARALLGSLGAGILAEWHRITNLSDVVEITPEISATMTEIQREITELDREISDYREKAFANHINERENIKNRAEIDSLAAEIHPRSEKNINQAIDRTIAEIQVPKAEPPEPPSFALDASASEANDSNVSGRKMPLFTMLCVLVGIASTAFVYSFKKRKSNSRSTAAPQPGLNDQAE